MGSLLAWYSGCHCTPNIKGASGRSMASITPSDGARGVARAKVSNRLMVERIHGELALAEDTFQHASAFDLDRVRNSPIHIFVMDDSEGPRGRCVLRIEVMVECAPVSDVHNLRAATYAENRQPSLLCAE